MTADGVDAVPEPATAFLEVHAMKPNAFVYGTTALMIVASAQAGSLNYLSQDRYVRVDVNILGQSFDDQINAVGFSEFDVTLSRGWDYCDPFDPTFCGFASGSAGQHSTLTDYDISAIGSGEGTVGPPAGSSGGGGKSYFEVDFSVDEAVAYTLDFRLFAEFDSYAFLGPSLSLQANADFFQPVQVNESGTLLPGDYLFRVEEAAGGISFGILTDYDLSFSIAPSCDFSGDGICNVTDLDLMQSLGPIATGVPATGNDE